jgi:hypothetical protein
LRFAQDGMIIATQEFVLNPLPTARQGGVFVMDVKFCSRLLAIAGVLVLFSCALSAQTTTQVFSAVDTRASSSTASYSSPDLFSVNSLNLSCPSNATATLSGPLMNAAATPPYSAPVTPLTGGGSLLVDNNIIVSVTSTGTSPTTNGPANVCQGAGGNYDGQNLYNGYDLGYDCFNGTYAGNYEIGTDPDTTVVPGNTATFDYLGGVAPISITNLLFQGTGTTPSTEAPQTLNISLADEGVVLTASTIFLTTNCTINGTSGGTVSGNPINTNTSTNTSQSFTFDSTTGQTVGLDYNIVVPGTVTANNNGSIPQSTDAPVNPATFQSSYLNETSFATANCLIHTGEQLNGSPACKVYTLECTTPGNSTPAGDLCPVSAVNNEVVEDSFDGPNFTLQPIFTPVGIFNEGIGLLMATDNWPTGNSPTGQCDFAAESPYLAGVPCPQNLLISFNGPGAFGGSGLTGSANSTFISIYGIPQPLTAVFVAGQWPDAWVNTSKPQVYFLTEAPYLNSGAYVQNTSGKLVALPNASNYIPAPIQSITYGISPAPASNVPLPITEPISTDTTVFNDPTTNSNGNPASGLCVYPLPTTKSEPPFVPAVQTLASMPDGQYFLHYYGEDCAGTQELQFAYSPAIVPPATTPIGWQTNFHTYPINIDTHAPTIALTTTGPITGTQNKALSVSYQCSDQTSLVNGLQTGSGVVLCGTAIYAPELEYNTPKLTLPLVTSKVGTFTVTLYAVDGAGNTTPLQVTYTVIK